MKKLIKYSPFLAILIGYIVNSIIFNSWVLSDWSDIAITLFCIIPIGMSVFIPMFLGLYVIIKNEK